MNKELYRLIYNTLAEEFSLSPSHKVSNVATALAKEIDARGFIGSKPAPAPARHAVSISVGVGYNGYRYHCAVANDGSLWEKAHDGLWSRMPCLPLNIYEEHMGHLDDPDQVF